jgi:flagellar basal body L-ring protein FlgH
MILKKCIFLALITMFACATFTGAQQRTKSRKTSKSKQPAKVSVPRSQTPEASPKKLESPSPQQPAHEEPKAARPGEVERITVEELKEKIAKQEPITIIDSRSQGSYDATTTKIKGAIRIPSDDVKSRLKEIPKDKLIVVYCT